MLSDEPTSEDDDSEGWLSFGDALCKGARDGEFMMSVGSTVVTE